MTDKYITFNVSLPTDNDYLGRECNNVDCKRYFKVHSSSLKEKMFCPYCSKEFSNKELMTSDQTKYINKVAKSKAEEIGHKMLDKMMMDFANRNRGNKYFKVSYKPSTYRAKPVFPNYTEQKVDSELTCPNCDFRFQVYGIFGYCPGCRNENLLVYDANLEILKREIQNANDINRALRHSYSDLVSTFEIFCKKKAKDITPEATRFQSLFDTRKFYYDILGVNIFKDLDEKELLAHLLNLISELLFLHQAE